MDAAADRRPQLPALSYLDVDKSQRHVDDVPHTRNPDSAIARPEPSSTSPTTQYPAGPPPPHSQNQQTSSWPGAGSRARTPPDPRAIRADDLETVRQALRQSLPSITEALNMEAQQEYGHASADRHNQPPPPSIPRSRPDGPASPPPTRRSYGMEPPQANPHYNSTDGRPAPHARDSYGAPSYPSQDLRRAAYPPPESRSSISSQNSSTHHPVQYPSSQPTSHYAQPSPAQSSSGVPPPPPPPNLPYGYTPASPRYSHQPPPPPSSSSTGPIYLSTHGRDVPGTPSLSRWKQDLDSRYGRDERPCQSYSDSVKRHLEMYDLEAALNEISSTSRIVLDFSRRYGEHMHQTARTGPSLSTLPSLVEIDDMINKSRAQYDSLQKIRDVVVTQQVAYEQQLADQRAAAAASQQPKQPFSPSDPTAPPPPGSGPYQQQQQSPLDMRSHDGSAEMGKGGFAGGDSKKPRRGRAAPPGRCHSCNRAETPEWRRGPDGARTLCNACGLHYAKLTRKQMSANKAANAGSSNLRPKE